MAKQLSFSAKDYVLWSTDHKKLVWLYKHQPDNKDVQNHELIKKRWDIPYLKTMMYEKVDRLFQTFIEKRYSALTGRNIKGTVITESEINLPNDKKRLAIENYMKNEKAVFNSKIFTDGKIVRANALVANEKGSYDLIIFYYAIGAIYTDYSPEIVKYTANTLLEKESTSKKEEKLETLRAALSSYNSFGCNTKIALEQKKNIEETLKELDHAVEVSDLKEKFLRANFIHNVIGRSFGKDLVQNVYACFINKGYVDTFLDSSGDENKIDASKYFLMTNITSSMSKIDDIEWKTFEDINIEKEIDFNKKYPYKGENYVEYFGKDLKDCGSIYDIPRITAEKKKYFYDKNVLQMEAIHPNDYEVLRPKTGGIGTSLPIVLFHSKYDTTKSELEKNGWDLTVDKSNGSKIYVKNKLNESEIENNVNQIMKYKKGMLKGEPNLSVTLKDWLDSLVFPLFFIDYETIMTPLSLFPQIPPLTPVLAQYSIHILNENGSIEHFDGLLNNYEHSIDRVIESMMKGIGNRKGTYVSWNKSYEIGRNQFLIDYYAGKGDIVNFFLDMNKRMVDLLDVFRGFLYYDTAFNGSFSIKRVFPIISPNKNYSDLEIAHGDDASEAILQLFDKSVTDREKDNIRRRLREYNSLDTEAMLLIFQHLKKVVS